MAGSQSYERESCTVSLHKPYLRATVGTKRWDNGLTQKAIHMINHMKHTESRYLAL